MIKKDITFMGQRALVACDEQCDKAWGSHSRPKIYLDENNEDDWAWLADDELETAPENPDTYEGGEGKPLTKEKRLNKWCVRECERCYLSPPRQWDKPVKLRDFSKRFYNMKFRSAEN